MLEDSLQTQASIQLPQLSRVAMCPLGESNKLRALHLATANAGLAFSFKLL